MSETEESRPPTRAEGLTAAEVQERIDAGLANRADERTSRTFGEIVRANVLTRFNALLGTIGIAVLSTGKVADALFLGVIIVNSLTGIIQEVRAKRTLDRLAVLHAPRATVRRDGEEAELATEDLVLDDLMVLGAGDQIVADGDVLASHELEVDESLLTGEADPIAKKPGDRVMSGSFVVAGRGEVQATGVGAEAYAHRLATEARRFSLARSELMDGTNRLLRWTSWVLLVLGPLLFISEMRIAETWREAMTGAAAGLVGMVPEGLVLLTTLAFMVAVLTLARREVLVQELPAVEGLARVDVVCLDKTGTLTEGRIELGDIHPAEGVERDRVTEALGALADEPDPNATAAAIGQVLDPPDGWERTAQVPFSSARKWSGATFEGQGSWLLGAPEMLLAHLPDDHPVRSQADDIASTGRRVVALAHSPHTLSGEGFPDDLHPAALVVLEEKVRSDAPDTLAFFASQDVELKVISGDNPRTVAAVARAAGLPGAGPGAAVDARELGDDPERIADALRKHSVFGRVSPQQKQLMVKALQADGHVVAMTGDGVNDALALKDADVGVAMGSGAAATRAVAQIVLLDGRFARMPQVLAEGRRVIANIERVAALFVVKNVMSALLSIASIVASATYPFLPRHMTIFSSLTIGIPAFLLALAPNKRRYVPGFLARVIRFSVPVGAVLAVGVTVAYRVALAADGEHGIGQDQARTAAMFAAMIMGLAVLTMVARPLRWWKVALIGVMGLAFAGLVAIEWTRELLAFDLVARAIWPAIAAGVAGAAAVVAVGHAADRANHRRLSA